MFSIIQRFEFDAGHRLVGHGGQCRNLHGHHYVAEVELSTLDGTLGSGGMVVDFGVVKSVIGAWIDLAWDHNMLLNSIDPLLIAMKRLEQNVPGSAELVDSVWGFKKPYIFDCKNPTAENMSVELATRLSARDLLPKSIYVEAIRLWETPRCSVCWERNS